VYHEVVENGRKIGAPEVVYVELAMQEGWLRHQERTANETAVVEHLLTTTRLHEGEAEALAMAASSDAVLLADDKEARRIARALGVKCLGTAGVLLEARLRGHISLSEIEDAITDLTRVSWQSPEVAALVLKRAREIEQ
jgi:predicted nucleic acid-binding protein